MPQRGPAVSGASARVRAARRGLALGELVGVAEHRIEAGKGLQRAARRRGQLRGRGLAAAQAGAQLGDTVTSAHSWIAPTSKWSRTPAGRVGERGLDGQALAPLVLTPGVDQAADLGGLAHLGGVHLLEAVDVGEDGVELLAVALQLLVAQAEPGEHGDVGDLVAGEGHRCPPGRHGS